MASLSKKVCLLGEFAVGKTSLVQRFVHNRFGNTYLSTIGVKVSHKTISIPEGDSSVETSLMLWDLAGGEEFEQLRSSYLRSTAGAMLVCDVSRENTLHCIEQYISQLHRINLHVPMVIVSNKCDLIEQRCLGAETVEKVATYFDVPCYCTSAKLGTNVSAAFRHLARMMNLDTVQSQAS